MFVSIAPDGIVTIVGHRAEMGTGVRTSLPLIVAEEMEADWSRVRVAQAPGDEVEIRQPGYRRLAQHPALSDPDARDSAPRRGSMLERRGRQTLGRAGDRSEGQQSRGDSARPDAGDRLWRSCRRCRQCVPALEGLKLKDTKTSRYLGKGQIGIVDLKDITTGKAHYGADTRLPGMKYAVIARPPVTGGKLKSSTQRKR